MADHLLIIEADEALASDMGEAARQRGFDAQITPDGKQGFEFARDDRPIAIVLCAELPAVSGYSICAKLKKDPSLSDVPLIFTSAEASQSTFEHHKKLKVRADEYLSKPFAIDEFIEALGRHVAFDSSVDVAVEEDVPAEEDIPIADDFAVESQPPMTLPDEEAFSGADPFDVGGAEDSFDQALASIASSPPSVDLSRSAGLPTDVSDEDELTSVVNTSGAPDESVALREQVASLRRQLALETARAEDADRRAAEAESRVQTPSTGGSREVLAIKKELNDKSREIVELRGQLHEKDRELLSWRDREMELEGRIVQSEEELAQSTVRVRELDARLTGLESERDTLTAQLDASASRVAKAEADLEGANELRAEADNEVRRLRTDLDAARRERDELRRRADELDGQLSRQLAELDELRGQLAGMEARLHKETSRREAAETSGRRAREALEQALSVLRDPA